MPRPRILLADDHRLLLEEIRKMLSPHFEIAGIAGDGRQLVAEAKRLLPDVIVVDVRLPLLNGIESTRQIHQIDPIVKLVVVTQHSDKAYVREAFRAGASAYVLKQDVGTELLPAIKEVLAGNYFISQAIRGERRFDPRVNPAQLLGPVLNARQIEVLRRVAQGQSDAEIANALKITEKTVEFHRATMTDELGLKSREELARYGAEHSSPDGAI